LVSFYCGSYFSFDPLLEEGRAIRNGNGVLESRKVEVGLY